MVVATRAPGGQGASAVRRLIALLAVAGCAQAGIPPGGPEDRVPPVLVRVTPDSNATNVRGDGVAFEFDEGVSERPRGVPGLAELFLISPSRGPSGVLMSQTSQHNPRRATEPLTSRAEAMSLYESMTPFNGNATTYTLSWCFVPGRSAEVRSSSPPGNRISPAGLPSTVT